MSDLDELDVPRPRPDALAARFVRRLDPWWGWLVAGGLLALAGLVIGTLVMLLIMPPLGIADGTLAAQISAIACLVLCEVGALVVFTRWRRGRIARKRTLIRDGMLASVTVTRRKRVIDKGRNDLDLAVTGGPTLRCAFNAWYGPAPGRELRVLWLPGCSAILGFDTSGRMYSGHVRRVVRR